jgi:hypothetical protein
MDFSNSKDGPNIYPQHAVEADVGRVEPIIGPQELKNRHLFGIPLVSQMQDPFTGRPLVMTDDIIQDIIEGAVNQAELETQISIWPTVKEEKYPFDRNLYESFGFFHLHSRPCTSVTKIAVTPANDQDVYILPLEWVELANLPYGQINIIPMTAAFIQGGYIPTGSAGGSFFLSVLGNRQWVPAYWKITCTVGFKDSMVPRVVNELIGTIAAMEVLSQLAVTYARSQSQSLGIDGLSQSTSSPGPAIFQIRRQELLEKKTKIISKIKTMYGLKMFSGHV